MDLDALRQVAEEVIPFNKFLGLRVTSAEHGRVCIEIPFRDELVGDPVKPALHGGVLSMLADTAGGIAVFSAVPNPLSRVSTIDLRIDYLRPAKLLTIAAQASLVRLGGHVAVVDMRLFHPAHPEDTIATGKGVYAVRGAAARV